MKTYCLKNIQIVNEGKTFVSDVLLKDGRIDKISGSIDHPNAHEINGEGLHLLPGVIDDNPKCFDTGITRREI
jgi:dihydroorotase